MNGLGNDYWIDQHGRVLHPAAGEMDENHINNLISFLQRTIVAESFQEDDCWLYRLLSIEYYIRFRIKRSKLWKALHKGLEYHKKLNNKTNDLNKGTLTL